jgi:hypothetical protein
MFNAYLSIYFFADRQLVRIVLIQIILVIISNTPYSVLIIYNSIPANLAKDINRLEKEYFIGTILLLTSYLYYVLYLYAFFLSLKLFYFLGKIFTCLS